ncbi:MAG: hypothetical protein KatS3mg077_1600 [Candidatus Binatia bacterium]|nr:MAG: hypothetical protein KatS3mg077_1600 [Candidatus Binatia bacterium]
MRSSWGSPREAWRQLSLSYPPFGREGGAELVQEIDVPRVLRGYSGTGAAGGGCPRESLTLGIRRGSGPAMGERLESSHVPLLFLFVGFVATSVTLL